MQTWTLDDTVCSYVFEGTCTLVSRFDPLLCNGTTDQVKCILRKSATSDIYKIYENKCRECEFFNIDELGENGYCWNLRQNTKTNTGACKEFKENRRSE